MAEELEGRVALVTGAGGARSIGRGIALALARRGADVAVNDVAHLKECTERIAELQGLGRRAAFIRADVSDPADCERLVAETVQRLDRLDIFCANAGVAYWGALAELTPDRFERIGGAT